MTRWLTTLACFWQGRPRQLIGDKARRRPAAFVRPFPVSKVTTKAPRRNEQRNRLGAHLAETGPCLTRYFAITRLPKSYYCIRDLNLRDLCVSALSIRPHINRPRLCICKYACRYKSCMRSSFLVLLLVRSI